MSSWKLEARLKETLSGIRDGFAFGALYCVLGVILYLVRGSGPTDKLGISLIEQLIWYLGAGISAGGIAGLLRPLTASRLGLMLVGFLAALPASIVIMRILIPHDPRWLVIGAGFAIVVGPLAALVLKD